MKLQIVKGSTSQIITVFIQDSTATDGCGLGSLDQTSSIVGGYVRTGSTGIALAVDENVTTEGTYEAPSAVGKVRIGAPANMTTGTYELHFHNDLFAAGANSVFITLGGAAGMAVLPIEIQLTDFDLNDSAPDVTLADGAHGGTSMVITFSRLIGSSAHADGTVRLDNSAGAGLHVQSSKVAGHAVHFQATGLGTSHGLWCKSDGDNANASGAFFDGSVGLTCTGLSAGLWATASSGTGFLSNSSAGYPGMVCMSGIQVVPAGDHGLYLMPSTDGHALYAPGNGTGSGICAEAGASGYDILADIQGALSGAVGSVAAEVDADVKKIDANSTAATVLKTLYASGVVSGSVDTPGGSETASAFTSDLTETTPDHYNGCVLVLTSGDAQVQTRRISNYNGTSKVITVSPALTEAPADSDTFLILGRIDG